MHQRAKNLELSPRRLEYGAVPLDAWKASDPVDPEVLLRRERMSYKLSSWVLRHVMRREEVKPLPYASASIIRITEKSRAAVADAFAHGWVDLSTDTSESADRAKALAALVENSLYDSHMQRVDRNACLVDLDDADPRVVHAREGLATPRELLTLLVDTPELGSIELAKLSHPLDVNASYPMDEDIYKTVTDTLGELSVGMPRYKTKTVRAEIPAITVLRKQSIGTYETESGPIDIVRRQAFLIRGDEEAQAEEHDAYLGRKVRNPDRHELDIFPEIEEWLHTPDVMPYAKFIQPLATSYYAKNLSTAQSARKSRR